MRILLTGGSGFVGSHLTELLSSLGHELIALNSDNCDLRDAEQTLKAVTKFNPEIIYHLAALAHVPTCEADFPQALAVNVTGTYNLLKAAKSLAKPPKVIFISSANVYGVVQKADLPLTEESPVYPDNNYATTKVMAEAIVLKYQRETKVPVVIFRSFNHIGPRQNPSFVVPNFVKQLVAIKNQQQDPILKVGNLSAERDFTDVRDIVKAYAQAVFHGEGIYNLCSSSLYSIQALLDQIINLLAIKVEIQVDPGLYRSNDLPVLLGSNLKVSKDLNWSPIIPIEQTLADIIKEYHTKN